MLEMTPQRLRARLHDGLCQQLTGALMFARALADALERRGDPLAKDAETLFGMVEGAANEVHELMTVLGAEANRGD